MEIDGVNIENMTNDEINFSIKQLYQSKTKNIGGGNCQTKVSIQALSSAEIAFNKNGKYYEWLKIPLYNNNPLLDGSKILFFQKNNANLTETIWWFEGGDYDGLINFAFRYKDLHNSKSENQSDNINIFMINYNE